MTLIFAVLAFASCLKGVGSDEETPGNDVQKGFKATCSAQVIAADGVDAAVFTITYDGVALTEEEVTFYDVASGAVVSMPNLTFTTTVAGVYAFRVEYEREDESGLSSTYKQTFEIVATSSINLEPTEDEGLTISLSSNLVEIGKTEVVIIPRMDGQIVTDISNLSFYNAADNSPMTLATTTVMSNSGVQYVLPVYTATKTGTISFWAMYGITTTINTPSTITAVDFAIPARPTDAQPANTSFVRRALVTQFTGTWCGNCPYMISALENVFNYKEWSDKAVLVAIHNNDSFDIKNTDFASANGLIVNAWPTVKVDILYTIENYGVEQNIANLQSAIRTSVNKGAKAAIAARTAMNDSSLVIRASVKAAEENEYFVGAWLLEDGLYEQQSNYPGLPGNFDIHNNVLRLPDSQYSRRDFYGHSLGTIRKGDVADHLFVIDLKNEWVKSKCHVVLFVSTYENNSKVITNAAAIPSLTSGVEFAYK